MFHKSIESGGVLFSSKCTSMPRPKCRTLKPKPNKPTITTKSTQLKPAWPAGILGSDNLIFMEMGGRIKDGDFANSGSPRNLLRQSSGEGEARQVKNSSQHPL